MRIFNSIKNTRSVTFFVLVGLVISGCDLLFNEQDTIKNAASYQTNGDHYTAIIELKKVLKHNASNKQARVMLARSYLATDQGPSADKELRFAKKLGVPMTEMAELWAQSMLMQKKFKELLQEVPLNLAVSKEKKAKLSLLHGYANLALNDKSAAQTLFQTVKNSGLQLVDANIALSRLAMAEKDTGLALKLVDDAIAVDNKNIAAWLHKGQILLTKQDYANANNAFDKVIEYADKSRVVMQEFQARVFMTQIALAQKNMAQAREKVDLLKKAVPKHPLSLYLSALVDYQEKKMDSAIASLESLLVQVPNDLRSKLLLGSAYYAKGSYEQANKHLSYFVENVPTHLQARKLLGSVRVKLGQHQDALDVLMPIGKDTDDAELLSMIGRAAILNDDPQQAEEFYKRAKASSPENQLLKKELADLYMKQGSIDEAIKELKGISGEDKQQAQKLLVYAHMRKQDFGAARKLIQEMLRNKDAGALDYSLAGLLELSAGERIAARRYFEKSVKLDSNHVPAILSLARMDFEDGKLSLSKDGFNRVVAIDEKNVHAMLGLSALSGRENKPDDALKWLMLANEKNPKAVAPRTVLAQFYIKSGRPAEAISVLQEIIATDKNDSSVIALYITAQINAGKKNEAMQTAVGFVKNNPKNPLAHFQMARLQQLSNDMPAAEKSLKQALRIKPDFIQASLALATLKIQQADYGAAMKIAQTIKQTYPKQSAGLMLEGEIYLQQKQFAQAVKSYTAANKLQYSSAVVRKLALAHSQAGKHQEAIDILNKWLATNSTDISARFDLALNYDKNRQVKQSQEQYQKIIAQSPDNIVALNNIALSYYDTDINQALTYAEKAHQLKPDIVPIADTLAWILLKKGDTQKALEIFKRIISKTKNPSIHYHYAVALSKSGEKAQAKQALKGILGGNTGFPEQKEAKQLLSKLSS